MGYLGGRGLKGNLGDKSGRGDRGRGGTLDGTNEPRNADGRVENGLLHSEKLVDDLLYPVGRLRAHISLPGNIIVHRDTLLLATLGNDLGKNPVKGGVHVVHVLGAKVARDIADAVAAVGKHLQADEHEQERVQMGKTARVNLGASTGIVIFQASKHAGKVAFDRRVVVVKLAVAGKAGEVSSDTRGAQSGTRHERANDPEFLLGSLTVTGKIAIVARIDQLVLAKDDKVAQATKLLRADEPARQSGSIASLLDNATHQVTDLGDDMRPRTLAPDILVGKGAVIVEEGKIVTRLARIKLDDNHILGARGLGPRGKTQLKRHGDLAMGQSHLAAAIALRKILLTLAVHRLPRHILLGSDNLGGVIPIAGGGATEQLDLSIAAKSVSILGISTLGSGRIATSNHGVKTEVLGKLGEPIASGLDHDRGHDGSVLQERRLVHEVKVDKALSTGRGRSDDGPTRGSTGGGSSDDRPTRAGGGSRVTTTKAHSRVQSITLDFLFKISFFENQNVRSIFLLE